MELIDGPNLATALQGTPLDVQKAAILIRTLATAMAHAHEHRILHRDLKPQNVLLSYKHSPLQLGDPMSSSRKLDWSCPKIVDFGLARLASEGDFQTKTGEILGTPSYMAPEMIGIRSEDVGPAIDIYGLGAILYECLTGRPPFQGSSIAETTHSILTQEPVPIRTLRPNVPRDLQTICLRCLNKNPQRRFADAQELASDLQRFIEGQPINSRPVSDWERAWCWSKRNPSRALMLVSLVALIIIFPSAGFYHYRQLNNEKDIAVHNYEAARASLWKILDKCFESKNAEIPRLSELALSQAKDAHTLFERLAIAEATPRAALDLARSKTMIGSLSVTLNHLDEAKVHLNEAAKICEPLVANSKFEYEALLKLTEIHNKLAVASMTSREYSSATESMKQAIAYHSRLEKLDAHNVDLSGERAWTYHNMGTVYLLSKNYDDAITYFQLSVALRSKLDDGRKETNEIAHGIAGSLVNLALIHVERGTLEIGETEYRRAIKLLERVINDDPFNPTAIVDLSSAALNLATLLGNSDRIAEAIDLCSSAIEKLQSLIAREPNLPLPRQNLFMLLATRAQLYTATQNYIKASLDWDQATSYALDDNWKTCCPLYAIRELANSGETMVAYDRLTAAQSQYSTPLQLFACAETWAIIAKNSGLQSETNSKPVAEMETEAISHAINILCRLNEQGLLTKDLRANMQQENWTIVKLHCESAKWAALTDSKTAIAPTQE